MFPDGFYATFEPGLRVHSPDGRVVAREGDDVSSDALAWPGLAICAGPTVTNVYLLSDVD